MRRYTKPFCKVCERHVSECGELSWRGKCSVCSVVIRDAWNDAMHYHQNPGLLKWRRSVAASIGAVLVEDIPRAE